MIERHAFYRGTFQPRRRDDLKPGLEAAIGRRMLWSAGWRITPEDGGPYVGEWAMCIEPTCEEDKRVFTYAWTPSCDLADLERVGTQEAIALARPCPEPHG